MQLDRRRADRERRQADRVPAVFAVRGQAGPRVELGQAQDIGPSGMSLRWPRDAAIGPDSIVALVFELPGTGRSIAAAGVVVSERRLGRFARASVRFVDLAPEDAALVTRYCRSDG